VRDGDGGPHPDLILAPRRTRSPSVRRSGFFSSPSALRASERARDPVERKRASEVLDRVERGGETRAWAMQPTAFNNSGSGAMFN
jgi:hypothetical protein